MGANSAIEWTDATWNPVRGCSRVSEGCKNCYAEIMAARFSGPGQWGEGFAAMQGSDHRWSGKVALIEDALTLPLRWKKPRKIFVNSTSDLFHEKLSVDDIAKVYAVMALAPEHIFQVLTKRPERAREILTSDHFINRFCNHGVGFCALKNFKRSPGVNYELPLSNVWIGTSVEDQAHADERIPHLLATPAAVRFLSCEPLLGLINLRRTKTHGGWYDALQGWRDVRETPAPEGVVDWVIAGGESGPGARPMHPDWARSLRDQCSAADVPFFFKQWGQWAPFAPTPGGDLGGEVRRGDVMIVHPTAQTGDEVFAATGRNTIPGSRYMKAVGKGNAGRLLDGREHNEFPSPLAVLADVSGEAKGEAG